MATFVETESYVYHIESDRYRPGNLLFADWNALKTTNGNMTTTIAGNALEYGYREGIGENTRFGYIKSFIQISDNETILSDTGHRCLRHLDRVSEEVATYAGQCGNPSHEQFSELFAIIIDQMDLSRILATDNFSLKSVDMLTRNINTLYRADLKLIHMLQDEINGDIYLTFYHGIARFSYTDRTLIVLAGSETPGFRDGAFNQMQFNVPEELLFLAAGILFLTDVENHRVRALNLENNTSFNVSVCSGSPGSVNGNLANCQLLYPRALLDVNRTLYIGDHGNIRMIAYAGKSSKGI